MPAGDEDTQLGAPDGQIRENSHKLLSGVSITLIQGIEDNSCLGVIIGKPPDKTFASRHVECCTVKFKSAWQALESDVDCATFNILDGRG
ncbi:hypothetical protein FVER14953_21427 [Fusarium verticillioides]|nr:hypothetical protein FVER14953_21427 [Fusarium verticillioides]